MRTVINLQKILSRGDVIITGSPPETRLPVSPRRCDTEEGGKEGGRARVCVWEPPVWKSALPSHPNSPFNLVHDQLELRARDERARRPTHPRCLHAWLLLVHARRCLFRRPRRPRSTSSPNSLSIADYRAEKRSFAQRRPRELARSFLFALQGRKIAAYT